ncbi:unnamed protein product [Polarella glacialis]|uniref:Calcium-activated potassium channel subunit alpha-1 n=1 Tax=Polarella glacialis TaxID=89957 RepID=A0A813JR04_POLGL|nr:unnamed protein product [Polarella glacialis]
MTAASSSVAVDEAAQSWAQRRLNLTGPPVPTWREFVDVQLLWPFVACLIMWLLMFPTHACYVHLRSRKQGFARFVDAYIGSQGKQEVSRPAFMATLKFLTMISAISFVFFYCRRTYTFEITPTELRIEYTLAAFFGFNYLVDRMRSNCEPAGVWTSTAIVHALTVVPILVPYRWDGTYVPADVRWVSLQFLRAISAVQAFEWLKKLLGFEANNVPAQVYEFLLRTWALINCMAGVIYVLEVLGEVPGYEDAFVATGMGELSYFQMNYWIVTTISTVGYGDYSPTTVPSRIAIIIFIFAGIIFFGQETSRIVEIRAAASQGRTSFDYKAGTEHLVIVGSGCSRMSSVMETFIQIALDADHWRGDTAKVPSLVFLSVEEYDQELKDFISSSFAPSIAAKVHFLRGSTMSARDLQRAKLSECAMAFIMPSVNPASSEREDCENIIRALEMRRLAPRIRLRLMLLEPEGSTRARTLGLPTSRHFSATQLKCSVFVQSTRVKGFTTLISGLLAAHTNFSPRLLAELEASNSRDWRLQYSQSLHRDVRGFLISKRFVGKAFPEAVREIYQESEGKLLLVGAQEDGMVKLNYGGVLTEDQCVLAIAANQEAYIDFANVSKDWRRATLAERAARIERRTDYENDIYDSTFDLEALANATAVEEPDSLKPPNGGDFLVQGSALKKLRSSESLILLILDGDTASTSQQLVAFLRTLRQPGFPLIQPVIVLSSHPIPQAIVTHYQGATCAFVSGPLLSIQTLKAAGVKEAANIVILQAGLGLAIDQGALADSQTVALCGYIEQVLGHEAGSRTSGPFKIYEYGFSKSVFLVEYMCKLRSAQRVERSSSPVDTTAAHGLLTEQADHMLAISGCGSWFSVFSNLLGIIFKKEDSAHDPVVNDQLLLNSCFAAGQAFTPDFYGAMFGHMFKFPCTIEFVEAISMPRQRGQDSFIWQVPCPREWVGKRFEELLVALASGKASGFGTFRGCGLLLALYRQADKYGMPFGCDGFLYTLPPPDTDLESEDLLTVLADSDFGQGALSCSSEVVL